MREDEPLDAADVRLLGTLAEVYGRIDPVPVGLADRARYAINVAQMEAEIAELTREVAVGVRSDEEPADTITFTSPSVSLMVSVVVTGRQARIDGWVTSGGAEVDVVAGGSTRTETADAAGRFSVEGVPRGPLHFVVRRGPGHRRVVTPTVDL